MWTCRLPLPFTDSLLKMTQKHIAMKTIKILLLSLLGLLGLTACGDDDETFPISPVPEWRVNLEEQYPLSMSAVVKLPENLAAHAAAGDMLGAFVGNECRGLGELVEVNNQKVYFVLIKGNGNEVQPVKFQYYGARHQFLYTTPQFLKFEVDSRFGSADAPEVLPLDFINP